ncbi:hypothetical protein [Streptomyces sp. NPDC054765]
MKRVVAADQGGVAEWIAQDRACAQVLRRTPGYGVTGEDMGNPGRKPAKPDRA